MDPIFENLPVLARGAQKIGIATNNIAEYKALIFALEKAISLSLTHVQVYMDSQLVIRQMRREYKVKNASLKILYRKANLLEAKFIQCLFLEIPRTKNSFADKLANNALDS